MAWYHRLFNIVRSDRVSRDIDREMAFHIAERVDELRARGMSPADAERLARRQFGNGTALRERTRGVDISEWMQSVVGDVRYALRALRHAGSCSCRAAPRLPPAAVRGRWRSAAQRAAPAPGPRACPPGR